MTKEHAMEQLDTIKNAPFLADALPCEWSGPDYVLAPLTADKADDDALMDLLSKWRKDHEFWYLATFPVSREGTRRWYRDKLLAVPDRILFLIMVAGDPVGHIGLFRLSEDGREIEIDNIVRGEAAHPGIMKNAIQHMMAWARQTLGIKTFNLQVVSDNERALKLYAKLGFAEIDREPLVLTNNGEFVEWVPAPADHTDEIKRYNVVMKERHE